MRSRDMAGITGQTSCDDADAGYYVGTCLHDSNSMCSWHLSARYRPVLLRRREPGYYADSAASTLTACAAGTYTRLQLDLLRRRGRWLLRRLDSCASQTAAPREPTSPTPPSPPATTRTPATTSTRRLAHPERPAPQAHSDDGGQSSCDDADAATTSTRLQAPADRVRSTTSPTPPGPPATTRTLATTSTRSAPARQSAQRAPTSIHRTDLRDDADAGYYVDSTASTSQTACSVATTEHCVN